MNSDQAFASSKKTYYYSGSFLISDQYRFGAIKKAYIKGDKLIIKGSLRRFLPKNFQESIYAKYLRSRTRKYKLTKNTKYKVGSGYDGWHNIRKSKFNRWIKNLSKLHNGLGFDMKVKNGKVIWMRTSP